MERSVDEVVQHARIEALFTKLCDLENNPDSHIAKNRQSRDAILEAFQAEASTLVPHYVGNVGGMQVPLIIQALNVNVPSIAKTLIHSDYFKNNPQALANLVKDPCMPDDPWHIHHSVLHALCMTTLSADDAQQASDAKDLLHTVLALKTLDGQFLFDANEAVGDGRLPLELVMNYGAPEHFAKDMFQTLVIRLGGENTVQALLSKQAEPYWAMVLRSHASNYEWLFNFNPKGFEANLDQKSEYFGKTGWKVIASLCAGESTFQKQLFESLNTHWETFSVDMREAIIRDVVTNPAFNGPIGQSDHLKVIQCLEKLPGVHLDRITRMANDRSEQPKTLQTFIEAQQQISRDNDASRPKP